MFLIGIGIITLFSTTCKSPEKKSALFNEVSFDSLPNIMPENRNDLIYSKVRHEAKIKFAAHQLPDNLKEWEDYRIHLKEEIIRKTGFETDHNLPLDMKETGSVRMEGYTVKNILFQTRPGIYATANLYVPDGEGPFPGVIVMAGHYINGRLGGVQSLGFELALNGYVAMTIDPWGAGERTTEYRQYEYHGSNLGASLMNIGESLMGLQIADNMRGVDLLCSLPYVDAGKIGATGASGGGNQTMWLTAMDERVKAAVPVVSVGTFESYVMGHNCICETLVDGLTFTEESGILALVAPRALLISNGLRDDNTAFYPSEMLRSFNNAMKIFRLYNAEEKLSHLIFDGPHSYPRETRDAMLKLFNTYVKGNPDEEIKSVTRDLLPEDHIVNFPDGKRDKKVMTTAEYCIMKGSELRSELLSTKSVDNNRKKEELKEILKLNEKSEMLNLHRYPPNKGWDRFALETNDGKLIPVLHIPPRDADAGYVIMCNPDGAKNIPLSEIEEIYNKGKGIVIADLSGTGEASSPQTAGYDELAKLHSLGRSEIWLGKRVLGEWVKELKVVIQFLNSEYGINQISIEGTKEAGLAGLFLSATEDIVEDVVLRNSPVSYLFDTRENIDFFSMGIHLPRFLNWGDVSLAAALSGKNVTFINPLTMSGQKITGQKLEDYRKEFDMLRTICNEKGVTEFK